MAGVVVNMLYEKKDISVEVNLRPKFMFSDLEKHLKFNCNELLLSSTSTG